MGKKTAWTSSNWTDVLGKSGSDRIISSSFTFAKGEDLRTVDGQVCESFIATCLALDLIEDDDKWRKAIDEAAIWIMAWPVAKTIR